MFSNRHNTYLHLIEMRKNSLAIMRQEHRFLNNSLELMLVIGGAILSGILFFWPEFRNGFSHIYSDAYDGVIEAILVSHWHWVFRGLRWWSEPSYFFPNQDTLGYNDSYFLYGVIASIFRALGADIFRAAELTSLTIKIFGYFSMYALLRRFKNQVLINLFVAMIFTVSLSSGNGQHAQLYSVAFAPFLIYLGLIASQSLSSGDKLKFTLISCGWVIFYCAWLMTSFYMPFFFGIFLIAFIAIWFCLSPARSKLIIQHLSREISLLVFPAITFVICITPFFVVYLPKLKQSGGHSLSAVMAYTQRPIDIINFGDGSLIWSTLYSLMARLTNSLHSDEHTTGFTPIFLCIFLVSIYAFSKSIRKNTSGSRVPLAFGLSSILLLVCCLNFKGHSVWALIYQFIPGAKGVRVISRYFIFLVFPMSVTIACYFHTIWQRGFKLPAGILLTLLVLEQFNVHPSISLDVKKHLDIISQMPMPPAQCTTFYGVDPVSVIAEGAEAKTLPRLNVQAMLIADHINLPTINGEATFTPPGWDFAEQPKATYDTRVAAYAAQHNVRNLCRYDISARKWSVITPDAPLSSN